MSTSGHEQFRRDPFTLDKIKNAIFAESEYCYAIYNISPIVAGHSLVIPKSQAASVFELPEVQFDEFWRFSRKVTSFLLIVFGTHAFDWTVQEAEEAGQSINHLHLHVIPRFKGDLESPGAWYGELKASQRNDVSSEGEIDSAERPRLTEEEQAEVACALRAKWDDWSSEDDLHDHGF